MTTGNLDNGTQEKRSSGRRTIVLALAVVLLAAVVFYLLRHGVVFDFRAFLRQLRLVSPIHAAAALLLIYGSYLARSYRWAVFLHRHKRIPPLSLLGTQFTGFTAVAIFGRIADLSRPYLVARKTGLPLPLQVAVYTIERIFDLGSAALIFSGALAWTPREMPHHDIFVRVGLASLAGTLVLAAFAVAIRVAGVRLGATFGRLLSRLSPKLGAGVEAKLLAFREGLNAIASWQDFLLTGGLSLLLWCMIALAYVQTTHAFTHEPTLAHLSFPSTMLLMGASIGSSLLQLPVIGWFTQIAGTATAMHAFYGTPLEPATACGALLLIVTFIGVIPIGLLFARIDRVKLGDLKSQAQTPSETVPQTVPQTVAPVRAGVVQ